MTDIERHLLAALWDALDGMEDMIGYVPEYFQHKWDHQAYIDRAKAVLAEFDTGEEGGVREPRGDSPDNPPAGESRVPGGSDDYGTAQDRPDDSSENRPLTLLSKISGIPDTGIRVYDMVIPEPVSRGELWMPFRDVLAGSRAGEGSSS